MTRYVDLQTMERLTRVMTKKERSRIPMGDACPDCDGHGLVPVREGEQAEPWRTLREAYCTVCQNEQLGECKDCDKAPLVICPLCDGTGRNPEAEVRKHIRSLSEE